MKNNRSFIGSYKYIVIVLIGFAFLQCSSPKKDNIITENKVESQPEIVTSSEITCPKCGHKKIEKLPTEVCVIKYNCEKCNEEMLPKKGDCCVYCTYGTHKCPSKQ